MLPTKLAFVDLETTGLSAVHDRIIEVGIVRVENNEIVKTYSSLVNPDRYIPNGIEVLTGIFPQDLEKAPSFRMIADEIEEILEDCVFVAHNVRFDYGFLRNEFKRISRSYSSRHFCTAKLSRTLFPNHHSHNLDSIIERFGFTCENRHRAFDDARILFDFYKKAQELFPQDALADVIKRGMKQPTLPQHLLQKDVSTLPDTSGVYIFYGDNGTPLYVGKSKHIRDRVLSHFSNDYTSVKEMNLSQQVKHIETIETAGELGALMTESELVKKLQPLYNRMLRHASKLTAVKVREDKFGYQEVFLESVQQVFPDEISSILGIFRSQRQAKEFLIKIAKEYNLCERLLSLEKTSGECFSYRLGGCKGACVQKEKPFVYNMRFVEAFHKHRLKQWPFSGPILIEETSEEKKEYFLVNKWCLLGRFTSDIHEAANEATYTYTFDKDIYKLLVSFILNPNNQKSIKQLTPAFQQLTLS